MTHSYGYKRRTRHKFQKGFRSHGAIHMSTNLTTFKVGDIVDVVVDGAIHKSTPIRQPCKTLLLDTRRYTF